jgi:fructokinase
MFGDQLRKAISEVGINDEGLLTDKDVHTTLAFVHTAPGGDRDFSFYRNPGADMMLNEDEVEGLSHIIREAKIFHFGTLSMTHEGCRAATKKAVDMAKNAGALISFDPNLREPLWSSLDEAKEQVLYGLSVCDILKISDNEIQWLTGLSDYNAGVEWIKERFNISLILVSLGKDGSLAYSTTGEGFVPAFVRDDTIETTGAGDTFCGCVLHYVLTHGMADYTDDNLREMLTFANAAASIITTRKGALRVMPDKAEIEKSIHHLQA